jgi:preprotein translocase subunit SecE
VGSSPAWPVDTTPPFLFGILSGGVVTVSNKESTVAGKDDKPKRENAIRRFFRETIGELRRVNWPTWPEARRLTIIVIIVLVVMSLFLWVVDEIAVKLLVLAIGA